MIKKKTILFVLIFIVAIIVYFYHVPAGITVDKKFNEYNGISTSVINITENKQLYSRFYEIDNVPYLDETAPSVYITHKNEKNDIVKYQYISVTDKSLKDAIYFFKEYYQLNEDEIYLEITDGKYDAFQTIRIEKEKWVTIIALEEMDKGVRISFDSYRIGYRSFKN